VSVQCDTSDFGFEMFELQDSSDLRFSYQAPEA